MPHLAALYATLRQRIHRWLHAQDAELQAFLDLPQAEFEALICVELRHGLEG